MRFPAWERMEMGMLWFAPLAMIAALILTLAVGGSAALAGVVGLGVNVFGVFALLPWVRVTGGLRWVTHSVFALVGLGAGVLLLAAQGAVSGASLIGAGVVCAVGFGMLLTDLPGTTPWYPSSINSLHNSYAVELLSDRCTGAAECVLVCPREVLEMDGARRKVTISKPAQCIRCGACIVQCPEDALRFRFEDGRVLEPDNIRSTHLNMLGRRSS